MTRSGGFVVWLTGLSGAGKSTLAHLLGAELRARGLAVEVLDGDEFRQHLSKGLGFSKEDRVTHIRRVSYVARLLARNGVATIVAVIAPFEESRREVRESIDHYVEVHVDCSIDELTRRDVKGLYRLALRGEIQNFTGISDPYERPERPEVRVNTAREAPAESLAAIVEYLERAGLAPEA